MNKPIKPVKPVKPKDIFRKEVCSYHDVKYSIVKINSKIFFIEKYIDEKKYILEILEKLVELESITESQKNDFLNVSKNVKNNYDLDNLFWNNFREYISYPGDNFDLNFINSIHEFSKNIPNLHDLWFNSFDSSELGVELPKPKEQIQEEEKNLESLFFKHKLDLEQYSKDLENYQLEKRKYDLYLLQQKVDKLKKEI
jgi:hypothetical protein